MSKKDRERRNNSVEQIVLYIIRELLQIALIVALTLQIRESIRNAGKMDRLERDVTMLKAELEIMKRH